MGCARSLNDGAQGVALHHAHRAQARDFHALELIEKPAMIGIGAAFGHGAEATPRPCQAPSAKRAPFRAQLARASS